MIPAFHPPAAAAACSHPSGLPDLEGCCFADAMERDGNAEPTESLRQIKNAASSDNGALTIKSVRDTRRIMMRRPRLLAFVIPALLASCIGTPHNESETRPAGENSLGAAETRRAMRGPVDFNRHVKPILEAKCVACHSQGGVPGRLDLSSREAALRSGALGAFIVPGRPDQSLLVTRIASAPAHLKAMPPVGQQVTTEEIGVLRRWIEQGANWPAGAEGKLKTAF